MTNQFNGLDRPLLEEIFLGNITIGGSLAQHTEENWILLFSIAATTRSRDEIIKLLFEDSIPDDVVNSKYYLIPLLWAIDNLKYDHFKALLDRRGPKSLKDSILGPMLLKHAIKTRNSLFAEMIVDAGADIEATVGGDIPLHLAAFTNDFYTVEMLLLKGADWEREGPRFWRVYMAAIAGGHEMMHEGLTYFFNAMKRGEDLWQRLKRLRENSRLNGGMRYSADDKEEEEESEEGETNSDNEEEYVPPSPSAYLV